MSESKTTADEWNASHSVGDRVFYIVGGISLTYVPAVTASPAFVATGNTYLNPACVRLVGRGIVSLSYISTTGVSA